MKEADAFWWLSGYSIRANGSIYGLAGGHVPPENLVPASNKQLLRFSSRASCRISAGFSIAKTSVNCRIVPGSSVWSFRAISVWMTRKTISGCTASCLWVVFLKTMVDRPRGFARIPLIRYITMSSSWINIRTLYLTSGRH